jgi:hypothetical protein
MPTPKNPCITFFDGLPTAKSSSPGKHSNSVLRVERSDGGGIVPIECRVKIRSKYTNLLFYLWIDRLLGKGRHGEADRQPYEGNC